jgi:amidohydrolase
MIADGVLEDPTPSASFGMHVWSRLPLNHVVVQEGPLWAGADKVDLVITGRGGHGAMPHETIDAVVIASEIVLAWQTIVSRNVDPAQPAVITVGSFHAGTANNVIAEQAVLNASIRSLNFEMRDFLVKRMRAVAEGICAAHGARAGKFLPGVGVDQTPDHLFRIYVVHLTRENLFAIERLDAHPNQNQVYRHQRGNGPFVIPVCADQIFRARSWLRRTVLCRNRRLLNHCGVLARPT